MSENKLSLRRSKSLCSLPSSDVEINIFKKESSFCDFKRASRTVSETSTEYVVNDLESIDGFKDDSGIDCEQLANLKTKVDRLSDLFLDQCKLLSEIKNEINGLKTSIEKTDYSENKLVVELIKKALAQSKIHNPNSETEDGEESYNSRARILLDAIKTRHGVSLDQEIREALVDFLQSDELKEHIVTATVASLRDMMRRLFSREMSHFYLPLLQRSQRRLARYITKVLETAFFELEKNSSRFSRGIYKTTWSLRRTLEQHQDLMERQTRMQKASDSRNRFDLEHMAQEFDKILQKEVKSWRKEALEALRSLEAYPEPEPESPPLDHDFSPQPPPPVNPQLSIIDLLMESALIHKAIREGNVNGSFERALSAGDLSLVVAACRAADPDTVFQPCQLAQPVLLSLAQQLATDMVHDTHLKCRFLEESIINLNPWEPTTHGHLPVVVGEIRKHLSKFLAKYPGHIATRRVTLIFMAADNLLK